VTASTSTVGSSGGDDPLRKNARPPAADATRDDEGYDLGYAWRALSVVGLASVFTALNQSTLNIALPEVVRHFDATSVQSSWILVSFSLVTTCVTLACGRLADVMGRRSMYLLGLTMFTIVSLLLGFSPNVDVLIALRVVQAIAGAMLLTNSAAIVSAAFPPSMLGRGLGIYMACFSIAQLLGPTVGGALATSLGWRWVFWFNVPIGAICLVWGAFTLKKVPSKKKMGGFDLRGNILLVLGLGGLIVALSDVASSGWGSGAVRIGIVMAVLFIPAFIWWERRVKQPLLEISLFRSRSFSMAILAGLINSIARSSVIVIAALYFQAAQGESALDAGVQLLPLSAANAIAASTIGIVTKRMLPRTVSAIGSAITTLGLVVLFLTTGRLDGFGPVSIGLILVGLGSGIFQPSNITSILEGTPDSEVGITNAVRITVQNTANVIGIALALTLLSSPLPQDIKHAVFAGTVSTLGNGALGDLATGYKYAFGIMAIISSLAVITSLASRSVYKAAQRELVDPDGGPAAADGAAADAAVVAGR
jgi:EmrB/QacA subfamily drug resistance transporter